MSALKVFLGIILVLALLVGGINFLITNDGSDGDFEKQYTCSSLIAFFNITPEENNCPLSNCTKINEEPYVDVCDCDKTKTKVFRQCNVQLEVRNYIGDADKLRGEVLTNNPELRHKVNTTMNPGMQLIYSDGSTEAY